MVFFSSCEKYKSTWNSLPKEGQIMCCRLLIRQCCHQMLSSVVPPKNDWQLFITNDVCMSCMFPFARSRNFWLVTGSYANFGCWYCASQKSVANFLIHTLAISDIPKFVNSTQTFRKIAKRGNHNLHKKIVSEKYSSTVPLFVYTRFSHGVFHSTDFFLLVILWFRFLSLVSVSWFVFQVKTVLICITKSFCSCWFGL